MISNQFNHSNTNIAIDYSQCTQTSECFYTVHQTKKCKLQQNYHNVPIFGASLVVLDDGGVRLPIFGKYYNKMTITKKQHVLSLRRDSMSPETILVILNAISGNMLIKKS